MEEEKNRSFLVLDMITTLIGRLPSDKRVFQFLLIGTTKRYATNASRASENRFIHQCYL